MSPVYDDNFSSSEESSSEETSSEGYDHDGENEVVKDATSALHTHTPVAYSSSETEDDDDDTASTVERPFFYQMCGCGPSEITPFREVAIETSQISVDIMHIHSSISSSSSEDDGNGNGNASNSQSWGNESKPLHAVVDETYSDCNEDTLCVQSQFQTPLGLINTEETQSIVNIKNDDTAQNQIPLSLNEEESEQIDPNYNADDEISNRFHGESDLGSSARAMEELGLERAELPSTSRETPAQVEASEKVHMTKYDPKDRRSFNAQKRVERNGARGSRSHIYMPTAETIPTNTGCNPMDSIRSGFKAMGGCVSRFVCHDENEDLELIRKMEIRAQTYESKPRTSEPTGRIDMTGYVYKSNDTEDADEEDRDEVSARSNVTANGDGNYRAMDNESVFNRSSISLGSQQQLLLSPVNRNHIFRENAVDEPLTYDALDGNRGSEIGIGLRSHDLYLSSSSSSSEEVERGVNLTSEQPEKIWSKSDIAQMNEIIHDRGLECLDIIEDHPLARPFNSEDFRDEIIQQEPEAASVVSGYLSSSEDSDDNSAELFNKPTVRIRDHSFLINPSGPSSTKNGQDPASDLKCEAMPRDLGHSPSGRIRVIKDTKVNRVDENRISELEVGDSLRSLRSGTRATTSEFSMGDLTNIRICRDGNTYSTTASDDRLNQRGDVDSMGTRTLPEDDKLRKIQDNCVLPVPPQTFTDAKVNPELLSRIENMAIAADLRDSFLFKQRSDETVVKVNPELLSKIENMALAADLRDSFLFKQRNNENVVPHGDIYGENNKVNDISVGDVQYSTGSIIEGSARRNTDMTHEIDLRDIVIEQTGEEAITEADSSFISDDEDDAIDERNQSERNITDSAQMDARDFVIQQAVGGMYAAADNSFISDDDEDDDDEVYGSTTSDAGIENTMRRSMNSTDQERNITHSAQMDARDFVIQQAADDSFISDDDDDDEVYGSTSDAGTENITRRSMNSTDPERNITDSAQMDARDFVIQQAADNSFTSDDEKDDESDEMYRSAENIQLEHSFGHLSLHSTDKVDMRDVVIQLAADKTIGSVSTGFISDDDDDDDDDDEEEKNDAVPENDTIHSIPQKNLESNFDVHQMDSRDILAQQARGETLADTDNGFILDHGENGNIQSPFNPMDHVDRSPRTSEVESKKIDPKNEVKRYGGGDIEIQPKRSGRNITNLKITVDPIDDFSHSQVSESSSSDSSLDEEFQNVHVPDDILNNLMAVIDNASISSGGDQSQRKNIGKSGRTTMDIGTRIRKDQTSFRFDDDFSSSSSTQDSTIMSSANLDLDAQERAGFISPPSSFEDDKEEDHDEASDSNDEASKDPLINRKVTTPTIIIDTAPMLPKPKSNTKDDIAPKKRPPEKLQTISSPYPKKDENYNEKFEAAKMAGTAALLSAANDLISKAQLRKGTRETSGEDAQQRIKDIIAKDQKKESQGDANDDEHKKDIITNSQLVTSEIRESSTDHQKQNAYATNEQETLHTNPKKKEFDQRDISDRNRKISVEQRIDSQNSAITTSPTTANTTPTREYSPRSRERIVERKKRLEERMAKLKQLKEANKREQTPTISTKVEDSPEKARTDSVSSSTPSTHQQESALRVNTSLDVREAPSSPLLGIRKAPASPRSSPDLSPAWLSGGNSRLQARAKRRALMFEKFRNQLDKTKEMNHHSIDVAEGSITSEKAMLIHTE